MKKFYSLLAATLLLGGTVSPLHAAAQISVDFFHENLSSHGDWREVGDYGYCWQPRDVDSEWRPYSDGRWVYTDAGWTWDSDEPYSWAVYHYGRWAKVERVGWVWVPGNEWGPAWVSWRRGPKHVGWAPLPPEARFERSRGFSRNVDTDYDIGPTNYTFVEVKNMGAPRLRTVVVAPRENITIINQTTNITKVTYVNNVVYNEGPRYEVISRESAQPIRRLRLERREDFDGDIRSVKVEQLRSRVEGDSLRVVALPVEIKPAVVPKKVVAKIQAADVDRGWKNAGPPAEVAKVRTKFKAEAAAPADAPLEGEKGVEIEKAKQTGDPAAAVKEVPGQPVPANVPPGKKRKPGDNQAPVPAAQPSATPEATPGEVPAETTPAKPGKQPKGAKNRKPADAAQPPGAVETAPGEAPSEATAPPAKPGKPEKGGKNRKPADAAQPPSAVETAPGAASPESSSENAAPAQREKPGKKGKNQSPETAPDTTVPAQPDAGQPEKKERGNRGEAQRPPEAAPVPAGKKERRNEERATVPPPEERKQGNPEAAGAPARQGGDGGRGRSEQSGGQRKEAQGDGGGAGRKPEAAQRPEGEKAEGKKGKGKEGKKPDEAPQ